LRVTSAALETAMVGELRHDVGKIQGELGEIRRLSYRVSMLEQCQSWFGVHSGARSLFLTAANDASRAWPHRRSASRPLNLESLLGLIAALPGPRLVILNTVQSAAVLAERFREAGQDVMPMCNWGLNLLVALTFLLLLDSLGAAYTFWLYAAVGVCFWIFA